MSKRLDATLFAACARFGKAVALEDTTTSLSYAQLAAAARETAETLRREGLTADEPVLVAVANAPEDIACFFGIFRVEACSLRPFRCEVFRAL